MTMSRRRFTAIVGGASASLAFGEACRATESAALGEGRLKARPRGGVNTSAKGGPLGLDSLARGRDAILRLPPNAGSAPLPLLLFLHGAGGSGEGVLRRISAAADASGVAVLAPDSRDATWDAIRDDFGPDVAYIDRALARVFETVSVDPARMAVGGFSDGASYALSLGLINGDVFQRVVAFSPGFIVSRPANGMPRIFISHGTADRILPIDQTSRQLVPGLQRRGYEVTFREFDGGHEVPPSIAQDAMATLLAER
jgi:predicted esterase